MPNGDLLREAIADAKAVRETALANAKAALEEAFTPKIQSMLTTKLKEMDELDEELDEEVVEEETVIEGDEKEEKEDKKDKKDKTDKDDDDDDDDEVDESVEIDEATLEENDDDDEDEEDEDEDDLDLESVIRELEEELTNEEVVEEEYSDGAEAGDAEDAEDEEDAEELDEEFEFDLDSLLEEMKELDEDSILDESVEDTLREENETLRTDLEEHREVIQTLRDKLNEINLLNAKLLYTNKLFKVHELNNDQKLKIIESLDRSFTVREVKLVYATLAESFKLSGVERKTRTVEGSASKIVESTKSKKKVITESTAIADRFKFLANIK